MRRMRPTLGSPALGCTRVVRPERRKLDCVMRVLLTNDDGIGAEGLHALRRALAELEGIETHVIAPDSNRSATARSITTRRRSRSTRSSSTTARSPTRPTGRRSTAFGSATSAWSASGPT